MEANFPIVVVAGIVTLLAVLACYALFVYSANSKREKRRLQINTLKSRARRIDETIACFPPNYLGTTLTRIIQHALIITYKELSELQPNQKKHKVHLQRANDDYLALSKQEDESKLDSLGSAGQIAGTRKNLNLLLKFFNQLSQNGALNHSKASKAELIIRNKLALLASDEFDIPAKNALADGKYQLAVHYFTQANTVLSKNNAGQVFNDNIRKHQEWIKSAREKAKVEQERIKAEKEAMEAELKNREDDGWKKKNVYD
ncbi:hypothetical protein [Pseudoteredinibacter isoporae]|uniref:Uncharacterized protein n=1 Tax=Pseudoteredinibacter isoporae TaxID=570281 RepID=A0A7X0MWR7_9GAMM|nr:hypothetical protein [Pseudoteredinibacter isoporae]MBB6523006.1 hypothetical protein [Pseudoteredinibacter isoporae]NHO88529.1 hypothetical protein [Pseudoteredinibacter isoporae]NIB22780.1 hypothetical protein [Pseudoteredinibacter isoporae]